MKLVIQRVSQAKVEVKEKVVGQIGRGMLIFLGVGQKDTIEDVDYYVQKILQLRMFADEQGKMNISGIDAQAEFLVVSQFTLYGDCSKGRRPSFDGAADPQKAEDLYNTFINRLKSAQVKVESGEFGAMMNVSLINDGPVTFILENES